MGAASFHRCGLVLKHDAPRINDTVRVVLDCLRNLDVPVVTDSEYSARVVPELEAYPLDELADRCDLMIVIGGDGTLLRAGRAMLGAGVPVLGINLGRLGFMVDIAPQKIVEVLPQIIAGHYVEETRDVLAASVGDESIGTAINDVVIRHPVPVSMLEFETYADDVLISHHRADGLIVSTPTGSTAYALSAGGPMLHPNSDSFAVVPICPHTLSDRPLILPFNIELRLEISSRDAQGATATLDGYHNRKLAQGDSLLVRRAEQPLRLIHPQDYDWYSILRGKLNWGREKPSKI